MRTKKIDFAVLFLIPVCGAAATVLLHLSYLNSILLFLGLPILYLSFRASRVALIKSALFAFIFALPLSIVLDYIIVADGGWFVPASILRILGIVPFEDILFGFLSAWAITLIYEFFLEHPEKRIFRSKMKELATVVAAALSFFILILIVSPSLLQISYAFLILCFLFLLLPLLFMLWRYPQLDKKYLMVGGYFFFMSLCWELSALYVGQWEYLGFHYIGWLGIFGFKLPVEEFVFLWVAYAPAVLAWYEFFDDDRK